MIAALVVLRLLTAGGQECPLHREAVLPVVSEYAVPTRRRKGTKRK